MFLTIFAMRDEKAELFIRPFFMPNLAMAVRAIVGTARDMDHPFAQHPSDFILYELGKWDEEHAEFDLTVAPIRHGSVKQLTPVHEQSNHDLVEVKPKEEKNGKTPVSHETPVFDRSAGGDSAQ